MKLNTCSAVISFITDLEEESAKFYEGLARKYPEKMETFLSLSKDSRKNKTMVERAYYGVITDALEACFSFEEGLDSEAYNVETEISPCVSLPDILKKAIDVEEAIKKVYTDAAVLSEGLMADVPRVFRLVARKRDGRIAELKAFKKM